MSIVKKATSVLAATLLALYAVPALYGCSSQETYTPELGQPKLDEPTIIEAGTLRVGVNTNNSPLAGKSGSNIIGIDVDIAAALGDELGLAVEIVDVGADAEGAIDAGTVDVALGVDSSSTQTNYWVSSQYLPTGVALFELASSNHTTPSASSSVSVAAQVSSKSAWAVNNVFGEESLESTSDLAHAFSALDNATVDYAASDAIIGLYAAGHQGVDVKIAALLETAGGYCAMADKSNTALQAAIEEALDTITSNGVVEVIEGKWLGQTVELASLPKIEPTKQATTNASDEETSADTDEATEGQSSTSNTSNSTSTSGQSSTSGTSGSSGSSGTSGTSNSSSQTTSSSTE